MSKKRLLILAGVVLAAVAIVSAALEHHTYRQKLVRSRLITWERFDRIRKGMRQEEVEAILGGPPGDFRTTSKLLEDCYSGFPAYREETWIGDEGQIFVELDEKGAVQWRYFEGDIKFPPTLADRVRAWLRREIRRRLSW